MANSPILRRPPIRKTEGHQNYPSLHASDDDDEENSQVDSDGTEEEFNKGASPEKFVAESSKRKKLYPDLPNEIFEEERKRKNCAAVKKELVSKNMDVCPSTNNSKICYLALFVLATILATIYGCWFITVQPTKISKIINENASKLIVKALNKVFDNQPKLSLKIIRLALEKVLDVQNGSQPSHPAILLLLSSKGAMDVTICFAKNMANMVSPAEEKGYGSIKGSDLKNINADVAKKSIDRSINKALQEKGQRVVLIENLDLIPAGAVMMLHSYCDHENAPFKDAVFIMTIDGKEDIPFDADSREFDKVASARLKAMWEKDLNIDQLSALLSRITVSVAPVFPSTKFSYCSA